MILVILVMVLGIFISVVSGYMFGSARNENRSSVAVVKILIGIISFLAGLQLNYMWINKIR